VTLFIIIAAAMAAIACAWIVVPLLRGHAAPDVAREASNVAILRDQLAELERDVANGVVAREHYDTVRRELEQRVIEESQTTPAAASAPRVGQRTRAFAIAIAVVLPLAAAALYAALGDRAAFDPAATTAKAPQHELTGQQVDDMIARLAKRLEGEPDNAEGWVMLAKSYYSLGRMPEAARALERATTLVPNDAGLLADYADATAAVEGRLDGKAAALIERALAANPTNWKALALAGTAAFNRKDYATAVSYWERTKQSVPAGSPLSQSIDASIAEARELGGLQSALAGASPGAQRDGDKSRTPSGTSLAGAAIAGEVKLGPALAGKAAPNDTVFVFARAAQGAKMPIAIVQLQVKDLPAKFSFDDSMAIRPEMKLSSQSEVVVGARVSKSGQAMPQSGDLEGLSRPVKVGASGVDVVIDRALP
jgi:cytochrome c-type biogenesis protein CcmH